MKRVIGVLLTLIAVIAVTGFILRLPGVRFAVAFLTPITFYGKVVDQFGNPVPTAKVEYVTNDSPSGHGTKHSMEADDSGLFSFHGAGISLYISVSKAGYYHINLAPPWDKLGSSNGFEYAKVGGNKPHHPDKANPVVFVLYKQVELEPLQRLSSMSFDLPKNGTAVKVNVAPKGSQMPREIVIKLWAQNESKTVRGTFSWSFAISAIDGGIAPRKGEFAFISPDAGYEALQQVLMPAELERSEWEEMAERSYFIKFDDGIVARINITVFSPVPGASNGGVELSGYLNPKVGSRNLETNPKDDRRR